MAERTKSAPIIEVALVHGPLDLADAKTRFDRIRPVGCGADAVFVGSVRPERDRDLGDLESIDYEAYDAMATASFSDIATAVCRDRGASAAIVMHSRGLVPVGGASVIVWAAARHRAAAFDACRAIMDELKAHAPIWKREVYAGGARWQGERPVTAVREGE